MAHQALVIDLLEWIAAKPRAYGAVMNAWRTNCPRLPIWEDAVDDGLVERIATGSTTIVRLTDAGRSLLATVRS